MHNGTIIELPYIEDSAALFEPWAEKYGSVFLDSGFPFSQQGRYDIISAEPFELLTTRDGITEIKTASNVRYSAQDPFGLIRERLGAKTDVVNRLPFVGGAIGYFGYDLARQLERLPEVAQDAENIPEMMIGIYDWAVVIDHKDRKSQLVFHGNDSETERKLSLLVDSFSALPGNCSSGIGFRVLRPISPNMSKQEYGQSFARIKRYIYEGDCYQVNLAQRFAVPCEGSPWRAYRELRRLNPAPFSAYLNFPDVQVLSSSPERFLKVAHGKVETKPIKGTRPRGADPAEDQAQIRELKGSIKDRAENLMIVDLLRNDLSKSCKLGSVQVPELFAIESFATVHHLVTTVCGELEPECHAIDLLRGCFPGGSITGAPKIRAMEIIEELEPNRRGIYCGSIGYIGFDGNMDSNIVIRTLVHSESTIRFWVGGGIVADSEMESEYRECFDKGASLLKLLNNAQRPRGIKDVGR